MNFAVSGICTAALAAGILSLLVQEKVYRNIIKAAAILYILLEVLSQVNKIGPAEPMTGQDTGEVLQDDKTAQEMLCRAAEENLSELLEAEIAKKGAAVQVSCRLEPVGEKMQAVWVAVRLSREAAEKTDEIEALLTELLPDTPIMFEYEE